MRNIVLLPVGPGGLCSRVGLRGSFRCTAPSRVAFDFSQFKGGALAHWALPGCQPGRAPGAQLHCENKERMQILLLGSKQPLPVQRKKCLLVEGRQERHHMRLCWKLQV